MLLEKLLKHISVISNEEKFRELSCFYDDDCGMNKLGLLQFSSTQNNVVTIIRKTNFYIIYEKPYNKDFYASLLSINKCFF